MYRIDDKCEILYFIKESLTKGCLIHQGQYSESPCNKSQHPCDVLKSLISDEDVLLFIHSRPNGIAFENFYNPPSRNADPVDVISLATAYNNDYAIFSGDRLLLIMCKKLSIEHLCSKAVIYNLDKAIGNVYGDPTLCTAFFFDENEENPFINYWKNSHCSDCCESVCSFTF
jgi:hypothetical protein